MEGQEQQGYNLMEAQILHQNTQKKLKQDVIAFLDANLDSQGALLQIEIENLQEYCKSRGHDAKDEAMEYLLFSAGEVAGFEHVYQIDHDNAFEILVRSEKPIEEAKKIFDYLLQCMEDSTENIGIGYVCSLSGGLVFFKEAYNDYMQLHNYVTFATHEARDNGKNQLELFSKDHYESYVYDLEFRSVLESSVRNDFEGFYLAYQPIVSMDGNRLAGAEALLRWNNERYPKASPAMFIPIMEETGMIVMVGRFVMLEAMRQCVEWQKSYENFVVHINLSYIQLNQEKIVEEIQDCVRITGVNPKNIVFEITESGMVKSAEHLSETIEALHDMGFEVALDDFGTGYSNFVYLKDYQLDCVKLDKTFVSQALADPTEFELLKSIIQLVHSLNMRICLEGVETFEELSFYASEDPDYVQGYVFGKPVPPSDFEKHFRTTMSNMVEQEMTEKKESTAAKVLSHMNQSIASSVKEHGMLMKLLDIWLMIPAAILFPTVLALIWGSTHRMSVESGIYLSFMAIGICGICMLIAMIIILMAIEHSNKNRKRDLEKRKLLDEAQFRALQSTFRMILVIDAKTDHCLNIYMQPAIAGIDFHTDNFAQMRMEIMHYLEAEKQPQFVQLTSLKHVRQHVYGENQVSMVGAFTWPDQEMCMHEVVIKKISMREQTGVDKEQYLFMIRDVNAANLT